MNARQKAKKLKKKLEQLKKMPYPKVNICEVPIEHYRASYMVSNKVLYNTDFPVSFGSHIRSVLANEISDKLKDKLIITQRDAPIDDTQVFTADIWIAVYKGDNYEEQTHPIL